MGLALYRILPELNGSSLTKSTDEVLPNGGFIPQSLSHSVTQSAISQDIWTSSKPTFRFDLWRVIDSLLLYCFIVPVTFAHRDWVLCLKYDHKIFDDSNSQWNILTDWQKEVASRALQKSTQPLKKYHLQTLNHHS